MRTICIAIAACLPVCGLAQTLTGRMRADPPSSGLERRFIGMGGARTIPGGGSFSTWTSYDNTNHIYFGFEALVEQQQPGSYRVTFGPLGLTPLGLAAQTSPGIPLSAPANVQLPAKINPAEWTNQPLPAIPAPQVMRAGDVVSVELFVDPTTQAKLFFDAALTGLAQRAIPNGFPGIASVPTPPPPPPPPPRLTISGNMIVPNSRATPTVEGTAHDFTALDAEMQIRLPRVTLNGVVQPAAGRAAIVTGALVWFYLPGRGRYILSLAPRPELDFQKAGEVRGGAIAFTLGGDTIQLDCPLEITVGHAPYILYVLRDALWEPTAQAQKGQFAIGSVDAGELVKLKRQ